MAAVLTETAGTDDALDWAVAEISVAIERLIAALPAGADLTQVAFDLVDGVEAMGSGGADLAAIFREGLIARRALTELGVDLNAP
jgi:hypothetical protein